MRNIQEIKSALECILFASEKPVKLSKLAELLELDAKELRNIIKILQEEYRARGLQIVEVAQGYQMCTKPQYSPYIEKLKKKQKQNLSKPALETLAIIAYRQPITRAQIEALRGVNTEAVLQTLLEKKLIKIAGRKKTPGRPIIYGTTDQFLIYFGLKDLSELPELEEVVLRPNAEETARPL